MAVDEHLRRRIARLEGAPASPGTNRALLGVLALALLTAQGSSGAPENLVVDTLVAKSIHVEDLEVASRDRSGERILLGVLPGQGPVIDVLGRHGAVRIGDAPPQFGGREVAVLHPRGLVLNLGTEKCALELGRKGDLRLKFRRSGYRVSLTGDRLEVRNRGGEVIWTSVDK